MLMGKRTLAAIALIVFALFMAACNKQACYKDNNKRKPPIPFASVVSEFAPVAGLAGAYTTLY
ncbi:hypothetical protein [Microbulbifer sp. HZ11]|uniref:hypothetical protein n=1 Tax=unclassified Microbulbifer TaxID=2619833 RepID=UPI0005BD1406|nr:hypothetical protein [Microbulbifer sp. HZ11]